MSERVNNIPQMSDEQRESLTNIMDVASAEMTAEQESAIQTLAEQMPTFRFSKPRPVVRDYKIGRNDPCPCGSGLKYKKCCLGSGKYESTHTV